MVFNAHVLSIGQIELCFVKTSISVHWGMDGDFDDDDIQRNRTRPNILRKWNNIIGTRIFTTSSEASAAATVFTICHYYIEVFQVLLPFSSHFLVIVCAPILMDRT